MSRGIATVGYGELYRRGAVRLYESLARLKSNPSERWHVETKAPCGGPVFENKAHQHSSRREIWDYTGYVLKPLALAEISKDCGLCLLLDASCVAIKPLDPLWEHIEKHGYYLGESGFTCGQWTSDEMLKHGFNLSRDRVMDWPQPASGIVGLRTSSWRMRHVITEWCNARPWFPGPHSNVNAATKAYSYRNEGFVSKDPKCLGHRHDQAALGLITNLLGMTDLQPWTKAGSDAGFVAYGRQNVTERSVLVVEGF